MMDQPSLLRRFSSDERGITSFVFGLTAVALVSFTGVAVEYSRAAHTKSRLQSALDTAVIAGLKTGGSAGTTTAENVFNSTFDGAGRVEAAANFSYSADGALVGRAQVPVKFGFGLVPNRITLQGEAEAIRQPRGVACLLLMDASAAPSLRVNGSVKVTAPNCEIHVHSTGSPAADFNGSATFDVRRICVRGANVDISGNPTLGPVQKGCAPAQNPFVGAIPMPPANLPCDFTNATFRKSGNNPTVIKAGVYCGTTTIQGNQTVEFQPNTAKPLDQQNLVIIRDGKLDVTGGSDLTGSEVTFFLANAGSTIEMSGNANNMLRAPTSGPYEDILMFEPDGLAKSSLVVNGGSDQGVRGVIHLPSRDVTLNGAGSLTSDYVTMVFNTLRFNGSSDWRFDTSPRKIVADEQIVLRR